MKWQEIGYLLVLTLILLYAATLYPRADSEWKIYNSTYHNNLDYSGRPMIQTDPMKQMPTMFEVSVLTFIAIGMLSSYIAYTLQKIYWNKEVKKNAAGR